MGANATTFVPAYVAGEVLTAADLTVTNSGIPVFADATARDAAFGGTGEKVLAEGQFAYLESTNATQFYDGSVWSAVASGGIMQVKSTIKTDTFSMSTATYTDVTGLSVAITPTSASNKILVIASLSSGNSTLRFFYARLMRDSTAIAVGDTAGNRVPVTVQAYNALAGQMQSSSLSVLDSPATTSAVTYKIQIRAADSNDAMYVNRSDSDTNDVNHARAVSTITVFEVTP